MDIIFGVTQFGMKFTLETNYMSLIGKVIPKEGILGLEAAKMKRWVLILAAYQYD